MKVHTVTQIEFDSIEFHTLKRVEPSVRIAFPTDRLDEARRAADTGGKDAAKLRGAVKTAQQQWEGRWLHHVCTTRQEWDAKAIHGAWDAAVTLEAVLEAQSDRAYWERELTPRQQESPVALANKTGEMTVSIIAPGTDVWGTLAEIRRAQLRDLRDALPILEDARNAVGPLPEPHTPIKYEGV